MTLKIRFLKEAPELNLIKLDFSVFMRLENLILEDFPPQYDIDISTNQTSLDTLKRFELKLTHLFNLTNSELKFINFFPFVKNLEDLKINLVSLIVLGDTKQDLLNLLGQNLFNLKRFHFSADFSSLGNSLSEFLKKNQNLEYLRLNGCRKTLSN